MNTSTLDDYETGSVDAMLSAVTSDDVLAAAAKVHEFSSKEMEEMETFMEASKSGEKIDTDTSSHPSISDHLLTKVEEMSITIGKLSQRIMQLETQQSLKHAEAQKKTDNTDLKNELYELLSPRIKRIEELASDGIRKMTHEVQDLDRNLRNLTSANNNKILGEVEAMLQKFQMKKKRTSYKQDLYNSDIDVQADSGAETDDEISEGYEEVPTDDNVLATASSIKMRLSKAEVISLKDQQAESLRDLGYTSEQALGVIGESSAPVIVSTRNKEERSNDEKTIMSKKTTASTLKRFRATADVSSSSASSEKSSADVESMDYDDLANLYL